METAMTEFKPQDSLANEQISVERDYETRYWARTLQCTETELREAVRKVGTEVEDVRRYLGPRTAQTAASHGGSPRFFTA
jgi:hypothetical protein